MSVLVLLLLLLPPVCGYVMMFTQYYYNSSMIWKNAQAFCRKYHIDLVTIKDAQEDSLFSGYGWIGLSRGNQTSPWKWSRGDELAEFTNWNSSEPQPGNNCAFKERGTWRADGCSRYHSFMCYHWLILVTENKTWEEALDHCRSLGGADPASSYRSPGYDLATLVTADEHAAARSNAQVATTDEVWTGMRFLAGRWVWVGGEQMQYENAPCCPADGSCGVLEKSGSASFSARDCGLRRNFFCYKKR